MFEKTRKAKGVASILVFGAICFVFVFMGMGGGQGGITKGGPAAIVNSKPISIADFRQEYQRFQENLQFDLNQLPPAQRRQIELSARQRALDTLVLRELIAQSAQEKGLAVSKAQLVESIRNIQIFQEDGIFKRDLYQNYLTYVRKTPADFEEEMQSRILVSNMQTLFQNGLTPVKGEGLYDALLTDSKINLEFIRFDRKELEGAVLVSKKEIDSYLKEDSGKKRVQSYYDTNKSEFEIKEQIKAQHILVMADPKDPEAVKVAQEKINKVTERLKSEKFSVVAKAMSDDTQSAKKGGDLGFFPRGQMVPEFEKAAFSMKKGETSDIVKTQYGFHIIKVTDKKASRMLSFESEKAKIAKKILSQTKADPVLVEINKALVAKDSSALGSILKSLKFGWKETGSFSLSQEKIPQLGSDEKIIEKAFQLRKQGQTSSEVIESSGDYVILRLKKLDITQPAEIKERDDVNNSQTAFRRSGDVFNNWVNEQRKHAKISKNQMLFSAQ